MEFFIKMITNHQCSFNRCNIIPRYSKSLNPWTLRAHIRTSWWMAYKILQVGGRTSTSNGISEMCPGDPFHFATSNRCALQSSLSFNQKDCSYCWHLLTRTWLSMLNSFWISSMYEHGLQPLQINYFWGNVFSNDGLAVHFLLVCFRSSHLCSSWFKGLLFDTLKIFQHAFQDLRWGHVYTVAVSCWVVGNEWQWDMRGSGRRTCIWAVLGM